MAADIDLQVGEKSMGNNDGNIINKLTQGQLHALFLNALSPAVTSHSDILQKPLEIDLSPPLPQKIRLYIYNATHPPGGRTLGEHKIQLIVPDQQRGHRGSFDQTDGRIVLLAGYEPEFGVFILWDAGVYPKFTYSRNIQVRAETVYSGLAGKIGQQQRRIRGQGVETVLTTRAALLPEAIVQRMKLTRERLLKV